MEESVRVHTVICLVFRKKAWNSCGAIGGSRGDPYPTPTPPAQLPVFAPHGSCEPQVAPVVTPTQSEGVPSRQ